MEETTLESLARQARHKESEIVQVSELLKIPVRYSTEGRVFYADEVRLVYRELFKSALDEDVVDVQDVLNTYPGLTKKKLRSVEKYVHVMPSRDERGVMVYSMENAKKIMGRVEEIYRKDLGQSLNPDWWPEVDDYCFLTEVNNCGPIYRAVRNKPYKPIMDEFFD